MNGIGAGPVASSGAGSTGGSGSGPGGNSTTNSNNVSTSGAQKELSSGGGGVSAFAFGLLPQVSISGGLNPSTVGNASNQTAGQPASSGIVSGSSTTTAAVAAAAFLDPLSTSLGLGAFELEEVTLTRKLWFESDDVRRFMRLCALLSLVSVSMNTSSTFKRWPETQYISIVIDILVTILFTIEFISKVRIRGSRTYFHDRWSQFDAFMLLCLYLSLVLSFFEFTGYVESFSPWSIIRSPRPLITGRIARGALSFSMPRQRLSQILFRSSQQIYNVTLFFLFFMSLFGLLGVQFFPGLHYHCVLADNYSIGVHEPTIHHLAIPDTFCSPADDGHHCPQGMMCIEIKNSSGYSGFDNVAYALFTVYQSASQEGWYHIMYQAMDSVDEFRSAFYFVTLIFFLAWLVKNVFIAVITETFNEIRVQFQQMWGERAQLATETTPSVLVGADDRWRLIKVTGSDAGTKAPHFIRRVLSTASFQIFMMIMIVINAMINASIHFDHSGRARHSFYQTIYPSEVFFTIFFSIEVLLKIWCYGFRSYIKRTLHKMELLLAIGSSIHVIPSCYMSLLVYFQVLRIIRLIKASPVLEDFVYKIFGPGKKLGSLIVFTMCLLIVTSSISMQLFCCFSGYNKFQAFPEAFMSMFQILTQEGWTEIMNETILRSGQKIGPLVAIYFILYHLFVSLIVLSLFVAVILDNLELDEDIKKVKQLKAREQSAGFNEELPLRLRLFESFPDSPQMTRLHKSANEFTVPKVRDSFMRAFIDSPTPGTTAAAAAAASVTGAANTNGINVTTGVTTIRPMPLTASGHLFGIHPVTAGPTAGSNGPFGTGVSGMIGSYHFGTNSYGTSSSISATFGSNARQLLPSYFGGILSTPTNGTGPLSAANATKNLLLLPPQSSATAGGVGAGLAGFATTPPSISCVTPTTAQAPMLTSGSMLRKRTLAGDPVAIPPIKLLSTISKGRHSSPLLRRVQVACIVSDSNAQRLLLYGDGAGGTSGVGPSSGFARAVTGNAIVSGRAAMRRSVRGNLKDEVGIEESQTGPGGVAGAAGSSGATVRGQDFDFKMLQRKRQQAEMRRTQRESDLRENHPFFDTPLLIVGRESRFRFICQAIVNAKYDPKSRDPITGKERKVRYKGIHELVGLVPYCDWLMIFITTISLSSMMCETGDVRVSNTPVLIIAEYVFVSAMALELTLKTLADGLLFTPNAYLANVAGVMDFAIFGVSLLFLLVVPEQVPVGSWQQTLMVARCVRPLRIFSLVPHMRKVVYELCRGFKEIALVSVLLIVLLFVFASVGVHLYGGLLARCNDSCITKREDCVGVFMRQVHVTRLKFESYHDYMPSVLVPRVWANPRDFNYDSIGRAFLALFEILSLEGFNDYRDIMIERAGIWAAIYIHVFVFLGCMIGLTLFVGVVIANYGENKGTALLTVDQRRWCDLKKRLKIAQPLHLPPRPDHHAGRAIIYDITQHIAFKRTIAAMVLGNSALLYVSWDQRMEHTVVLTNVSACLTGAFVFEVLMKMIAFTPRGYWQSRRNRYDLFVTVLGVLWLILHFTLRNQTSNAFGFIVVILRFFTITGKHATLKMLMLTVAVSVYKSFFIIMGLFLLILCYALAGVILFGSVKFGENVSRHANFRIAPVGVITLFRIVTGEDWNKIMHDAMLSPPFCTPGDNFWSTDCGNYYASLAFFCSFYVCITYIVLNLLVAIIMENFSLFYSNEEDALLSYADIRNFQNTWNLVDIQQRGMIPVSRVKFVLRLLKGRLEVDPNKDRLLFKHMCHEMERLHNGEDVTFHDVLNMLSYRSVDIRKSLQLEELLAREELEFLIEEEVAKATIRAWLDKCLRRIKKERQQQSLINSLRATNEQQTPAGLGTPPSASHAFFPSEQTSQQTTPKESIKSILTEDSKSSDDEKRQQKLGRQSSKDIEKVPLLGSATKSDDTVPMSSHIKKVDFKDDDNQEGDSLPQGSQPIIRKKSMVVRQMAEESSDHHHTQVWFDLPDEKCDKSYTGDGSESVDDSEMSPKSNKQRKFVSLHSYPPTLAGNDTGPETGTVTLAQISGRSTSLESTTISEKELETEVSAGVAAAASAAAATAKPTTYSSRLKSLRSTSERTAPSSMLQTRLQSTIQKRIALRDGESTGKGDTAVDGLQSIINAVTGAAGQQLQRSNIPAKLKIDLKRSTGSSKDNTDLDGGVSSAAAAAAAAAAGPGTAPDSNKNDKKFNVVRAQMLVNEVHDWWLMHLK